MQRLFHLQANIPVPGSYIRNSSDTGSSLAGSGPDLFEAAR